MENQPDSRASDKVSEPSGQKNQTEKQKGKQQL